LILLARPKGFEPLASAFGEQSTAEAASVWLQLSFGENLEKRESSERVWMQVIDFVGAP